MSEILNLFNMTAQQVHTMAKENSVTESPIFIGGATIIPISKISCGFAAGGSEMAAKKNGKLSAGAGAKVTKTPLSFLAIIDGNLQVLYVNEETAKEDACKIEHDLSAETFKMIEEYWKKINTKD